MLSIILGIFLTVIGFSLFALWCKRSDNNDYGFISFILYMSSVILAGTGITLLIIKYITV